MNNQNQGSGTPEKLDIDLWNAREWAIGSKINEIIDYLGTGIQPTDKPKHPFAAWYEEDSCSQCGRRRAEHDATDKSQEDELDLYDVIDPLSRYSRHYKDEDERGEKVTMAIDRIEKYVQDSNRKAVEAFAEQLRATKEEVVWYGDDYYEESLGEYISLDSLDETLKVQTKENL